MELYFDLMGASATAGAQALADVTLLLQVYLIGLVALLAALLVAIHALTCVPHAERSEVAMRQRLWELILSDSAACASSAEDVAGTRLIGRTVAALVAPDERAVEPVDADEPAEGQGEQSA